MIRHSIGTISACSHTNSSLLCFLLERPPEVPTIIPVSIESNGATVDISITWDSAFNLFHSMSSYRGVRNYPEISYSTSEIFREIPKSVLKS